MPNAIVTLYLTDEEYVEYVKYKKQINAETREYIKARLKIISDGGEDR